MSKIRLLELFGGIGSCSSALDRLGIDYEIADYVEIDKYAVPVDVINDLYISKDKIREFMKDYQEGDMLEITGVCKFLLGE